MPIQNRDCKVLVIGTSQGIGLATTERLLEVGYQVTATTRTPEAPSLVALKQQYPHLSIKKLDVTDSEENIQALIQTIGTIDILINNAGIGLVGTAESFSVEQIQAIFDTNVLGVVKVTDAVLPGMRARNSGMIVTVSSIVGPLPAMRQCFYSGSKAMIEHYTAALKQDLIRENYHISVANIHPGPVLTNFASSTPSGNRFQKGAHPYPHMQANVDAWRLLMQAGHPVEETVCTILKVIQSEAPPFWNPTEEGVKQNFIRVYKDPTGRDFSEGPVFFNRNPSADTNHNRDQNAIRASLR